MKRLTSLGLVFLVGVLGVGALRGVSLRAQTPPSVPTDCSGTLTTSELEAVAWYMVNDPENSSSAWAACVEAFDIDIDDNYYGLVEEMEDLGWSSPPPDPDDPPWGMYGSPNLPETSNLPETTSMFDDSIQNAVALMNLSVGILEYQCSGLPCWKQMVQKAGRVSSCPAGYTCLNMSSCYETTTWCDNDSDKDLVCSTAMGSKKINNPDTARMYASSNALQGLIPSAGYSSDGNVNDYMAHVCVSGRTRFLAGDTMIRERLRFRHDSND